MNKLPYRSRTEHLHVVLWSWWFAVVDRLPARVRRLLPRSAR